MASPLPSSSNPAEDPILPLTNNHRWAIVGLLFTASMINYFDRATLSFALPLISAEFKLDAGVQGILLSAFSWTYAIMQLPAGICADKSNLRTLYAVAFAMWSVAQGLMGLAQGLTTLIIFRMLLGIGESIYLPGGTKIVSRLFKSSERGLPCGIFDFGTRTGLVLEGLLMPWMLEKFGWRKTFVIVGFTGLLWLIPWLMVLPKSLKSAVAGDDSGKTGFFDLSSLKGAFVGYNLQTLLTATGALARNRNLVGICIGYFCFDYYWFLLLSWLPSYLIKYRDMGMLKGGFSAALPFLVFGLCQPIGGWLADWMIRRGGDEMRVRKGIIAFAFLTGLCLIPITSVKSNNVALTLFLLGGLVGLSTANMLVILQACAPMDKVGTWVGVYNFIGNIAGILAPIVTGKMVKSFDSFTVPFVAASLLLLVGIAAFYLVMGKVDRATS